MAVNSPGAARRLHRVSGPAHCSDATANGDDFWCLRMVTSKVTYKVTVDDLLDLFIFLI